VLDVIGNQRLAEAEVEEAHIGEDLLLVGGYNPFGRSQFEDDPLVYHVVGVEASVELECIVDNRHRQLPHGCQSPFFQFA
jgi:hypothetical protein